MPSRVISKSSASRRRDATTRLARYGTVMTPTAPARSNAVEANSAVAATLPDSRAMVERMAAIKAKPKPRSAIRNRSQASASMLARTDFRVVGSRIDYHSSYCNTECFGNVFLALPDYRRYVAPDGPQLFNFEVHSYRMLQRS